MENGELPLFASTARSARRLGDDAALRCVIHPRAEAPLPVAEFHATMRIPAEIIETQQARATAMLDAYVRRNSVKPTRAEEEPIARSGMEPLEKEIAAYKKLQDTPIPTERTALFSKADPARVADINASRLRAEKIWGFPKPLVQSEVGFMSSLAIQMLLSNIIDFMPAFVSGVFTGHLSDEYSSEYIAAKSLSAIFMMLTGYTINIAIGAAMDTLCAQAYGAGKLHEMGIFFQTGILLFSVCFFPVTLVSYYCVDIMVLLGQRRDIALLAQNLVLYTLPSLPFSMINSLLCKILQGQNIIKPMVYAGLVGNVVHDILIYYLMFHTSVGYLGSSIATSGLVVCYTITLCIYFFQSHLYQREWPGWRIHDAMRLIPEFIRLGLCGLGMTMFEFWAFSTVALLAGWLPFADVAISADSTYSSFRYLCGLLYGTISVAGSVRVGNALGANDPQRAKLAAYLSVGISVVLALGTTVVMVLLRNIYPYAYTNDSDVVDLASSLMLITCPFQVFAGITSAVQGVMRGSGMQALGARVNFVAYLTLAIPISLTLAYQFELGLYGLWLGLCAGFVCSGTYCMYWLLRANWTEMAIDAQKRTREPAEMSPLEGNACLC
ncbi:hypothetical protein Poli38472_002607 [Pythium oligandrum]|uniref:Multidrug and toxic compound extrusion protein n=1 Tax=Pythium oligandrum TaxID=41045 RepID=A0A8K1CHI2_PYTOL|nr:hypothetical protein Poli38472_002607 [Pythium oligandrum]|eukprot:TMW63666.1 hypothetical protein Poli38472_002607 [Pythium oligandrum]